MQKYLERLGWYKTGKVKAIAISVVVILLIGLTILYKREASGKVVLRVAWGEKKGELGFVPHSADVEDQGPTSFIVTEDDKIYVLDTVNRRINSYAVGKFNNGVKLQTKYYPHDLFIDKDAIYILTHMTIEKLDLTGKIIKSQFVGLQENLSPWRLRKLAGIFVVTFGESMPPESIVCFNPDLNTVDCNNYKRLFQEYDVMEFTSDGWMVIPDDGRIKILSPDEMSVKKSIISPNVLVSEELYPRVTAFRIIGNKAYTMVPDQKGISFYEYNLQ